MAPILPFFSFTSGWIVVTLLYVLRPGAGPHDKFNLSLAYDFDYSETTP